MPSPEPTELDIEIGRRLLAFRLAFELTQEELAPFLGVSSRQGVSNYERGERGLSPEIAIRLWEKFTVSPNYFYLGLLNDVPQDKLAKLANLPPSPAVGRPPKGRRPVSGPEKKKAS